MYCLKAITCVCNNNRKCIGVVCVGKSNYKRRINSTEWTRRLLHFWQFRLHGHRCEKTDFLVTVYSLLINTDQFAIRVRPPDSLLKTVFV